MTLDATLQAKLKPVLDDLENFRFRSLAVYKKRKEDTKTYGWIFYLLPFSGLLFGLDFVDYYRNENWQTLLVYAFFLSIGLVVYIFAPVHKYKKEFKACVLPCLFKVYGDFKYDVKGSIDFRLLQMNGVRIIPKYSRIETEDYIQGMLDGNIAFEFCEVNLMRRSNNNNVSVFSGCAIVLSLPFEFDAETLVMKDAGFLNKLGATFSDLKRVSLENPVFEKKYEVYSQSQQEARYIFTPAMMERYLKLTDSFSEIGMKRFHHSVEKEADKISTRMVKTAPIQAAFIKNRAVFMIPSSYGDFFDSIDIEVSAYDLGSIASMLAELEQVFGVAEQLKLDYMARRKVGAAQVSV